MNNVRFKEWDCKVVVGRYSNQRIAFDLIDPEDGCPIARALVNLVDEPMGEDEVAIKDYSENEGMLDSLLNAGIVYPPHRYAVSGFTRIPICKVSEGVLKENTAA